ncbi:probable galacturonosyltransferase 15 isoform X2 [Phragmites australis]|uniref:probable galacturonosyltransferase 15 isoform X2 n=1 Tax=Phragmites australis TaxID=29695 RepID=UPI002D78B86D|nr:probable galacturonosyltransferase 15 isoform X2 [Phragmites australis]
MRVYITAAADDVMKPKAPPPQQQQQQAARRGCRSVVVTGLLAGVLLFRAALLAIEAGASLCPSSTGCLDWRAGLGDWLYGGGDAMEEFMTEWKRSHREATLLDPVVVDAAPDSLDGLMAEMSAMTASYDRLDMEAVVIKITAMLLKMDRKVKSSRIRALFNRHLASLGIPKSMHCLTLRLAEEFAVNSAARSPVPLPEHAPRLTDASYLHVALVTDNVLAAAVAVASTVGSSADPTRLVFHVVTDKKSYVPMHSWFALHPVSPAVVEVKGLHQFDWRDGDVIASVMRTIEEVQKSSLDFHQCDGSAERENRRLEASKPSTFSLLNYLKIHLPEFFPELGRVMLLDDDVVVRKDLAGLWELNLDGNIIGAVGAHLHDADGGGTCIDKTFGDHLNFSDPAVSSLGLRSSQCAWSWGVNIVDLDAWRRTNVTKTYQFWLQKNRESGFRLWQMASLPPSLIAFDGRVQAVDPLWHLPGLGWRMPDAELVQFSTVLHFSGPRKPWLEVAFPELRQLWLGHLNVSDSFLQGCGVVE